MVLEVYQHPNRLYKWFEKSMNMTPMSQKRVEFAAFDVIIKKCWATGGEGIHTSSTILVCMKNYIGGDF